MTDHLNELTEMTFAHAQFRLHETPPSLPSVIPSAGLEKKWLALTIHKSLGTFCVRGVSTDSREDFLQLLEEQDPYIMQQLRWDDLEKPTLFFVKAPTEECAYDVLNQLCCRRFPLFDQNFAGPLESGQTWWMGQSEHGLSLYFRSLGTLGFQRILLGPLGIGPSMTEALIPHVRDIEGIFNLEHFSLSERGCEIRFHPEHTETTKIWNSFLLEGRYHPIFAFCDEHFSAGIFQKIAFRRRFWMAVEAELKEILQ